MALPDNNEELNNIPQTGNVKAEDTQFGPNKTAARNRLSEAYPDLDLDDEEGLYGAWNDEASAAEEDRKKLKDFEDSDAQISEALAADPRNAGFLTELLKGSNGQPLEYLIDNYGDDFVELLNDPDNDEFRKRLAEKHSADIEKAAKQAERDKEAEANIEPSLNALDAVAEEMGISDEEKAEVFKSFIELCQDLMVNKVSEDVWRMLVRGYTYEADVEQAGIEGETRGRNSRIREKLATERNTPSSMINSSSTPTAPARPQVKLGGALDEPTNAPWYER